MTEHQWKLFKRLIDVCNRRGWDTDRWHRMVADWRVAVGYLRS